MCIDDLVDLKGETQDWRTLRGIGDDGSAGQVLHVLLQIAQAHHSILASSNGSAFACLALVAYDGVLRCGTPCCEAGGVFPEGFGERFDVFELYVFVPERFVADLVVALVAGFIALQGVWTWLLFFVVSSGIIFGPSSARRFLGLVLAVDFFGA